MVFYDVDDTFKRQKEKKHNAQFTDIKGDNRGFFEKHSRTESNRPKMKKASGGYSYPKPPSVNLYNNW